MLSNSRLTQNLGIFTSKAECDWDKNTSGNQRKTERYTTFLTRHIMQCCSYPLPQWIFKPGAVLCYQETSLSWRPLIVPELFVLQGTSLWQTAAAQTHCWSYRLLHFSEQSSQVCTSESCSTLLIVSWETGSIFLVFLFAFRIKSLPLACLPPSDGIKIKGSLVVC